MPAFTAVRTRRAIVAAAALVVVAADLPRASAVTRTWVGADGAFWSSTSSWSGSVVPVNGDDAVLGTNSAATTNVLANYTSVMSGVGLNSLKINSTGIGGTFTVSQTLTTSVMIANTEIIGDTIGLNVYTQNAGANNVASLTLGNQSGGGGTYNLSNLGTVNVTWLTVGNSGAGVFNQSGGTLNVSNRIEMGEGASTFNAFNLSGGTLNLTSGSFIAVGNGTGSATFAQTGGTLSGGAGQILISNGSGSSGSYSLSGTGSLTTGILYLGNNLASAATFTQSGGTATVNNTLVVANSGTVTASYNMSGGSLTTANSMVGGGNVGTFNQTGGTHSITGSGTLSVGQNIPATGNYVLNGASAVLSAPNEVVGVNGRGAFTHSAGTNNVSSSLTIGQAASSTAVYTLSGGALNVSSGYVYVADQSGDASLVQTGGTIAGTGSSMILGYNSGSHGTYSLKGGSAAFDSVSVGSDGAGVVNHTGGTFSVTGYYAGLTVGNGFFGGGSGTYSLTNTNVATPSVLNTSYTSIGYGGDGYFYQGSNTTHTNTGSISIGYSETGTYNMQGGTLTSNGIYVGLGGQGVFNQGNGTVTAAFGIAINQNSLPGTTGEYRLSFGTLNVPAGFSVNTYAGGTFSQTGGTCNADLINAGTLYYSYGTFSGYIDNAPTGSIMFNTPATLLAGKGIMNRGTVTITAGNGVGVSNAAYQFDNQANVELAGGALTGSANLANNGTMTGWGTITGSGGFTNNGVFNQGAGTVIISNTGANTNNASMTLAAGRQLQLLTNLTNAGSLELNSAVVTGAGTLTNAPGGILLGPGTISGGTVVNAGTLLAPAGTTRVAPNFTNSGLIQLDHVAATVTGGTINNTGSIQGSGKVANAVTNAGTITPAGTLNLAGALTNSGLLIVPAAAKLLVSGAFPTNAGTITLQGGTFDTNNQALANNSVIAGYGTLSTGGAGLTNNGSITFTGGNTTVTGPVTNVAGKTLEVRFNPALFTGAVVNNGTLKVTGTTVTFAGSYAGTPPSEPGGVVVEGMQGPGLVGENDGGVSGPGALVVDPAGVVVTSYVRQASVVAMSGTILTRPSAAGGQTSVVSTLTLTGSASLDLADNNLIIDGADAGAVASATTQLRQYLFNNSVTSSIAAGDPQQRMGIGYASSAELGVATWGIQSVDATAVLTKMTYRGDANLDGRINADDFALIDRGFSKHLSTWAFGDFNYDGQVTSADYLLIDRVFMQQTGVLSPSLLAQREAQFGSEYVAALVTSVPEPSLAGCGLVAAGVMFARRRRD